MTSVKTARELQNLYMSGTSAPVAIDATEFANSYGRYAIFAGVQAFYSSGAPEFVNARDANGNLDIGLLPESGKLSFNVNHLITDVGSADYLNRTLGYGDQKYDLEWSKALVNGEWEVTFKLIIRNEDYDFTGSGANK